MAMDMKRAKNKAKVKMRIETNPQAHERQQVSGPRSGQEDALATMKATTKSKWVPKEVIGDRVTGFAEGLPPKVRNPHNAFVDKGDGDDEGDGDPPQPQFEVILGSSLVTDMDLDVLSAHGSQFISRCVPLSSSKRQAKQSSEILVSLALVGMVICSGGSPCE
uniref:Uncharacterized protein n=1 Tax=Nelumbo nucifera TaxID=4432 RepID=A0A822ZMR1_NELNU|nr:TPA_asm: hypothetical protein HUJ06_004293 [Nelumbo nucifera]